MIVLHLATLTVIAIYGERHRPEIFLGVGVVLRKN